MGVKVDNPRDIDSAYDDLFDLEQRASAPNTAADYAAQDQRDAAVRDSQSQDLGDVARTGEQTGGRWINNTTNKAAAGIGGMKGALSKAKVVFQKKGAIGVIVAVLGIGGAVPFLGTASLPFSMLGNRDAKSMLRGLEQYNQDFLSYRLFGANKAASLKNGKKGELSGIRDADIKKLEARGLEFRGSKKNTLTGKTTFTEVRLNNGKWLKAGKEFNDEIRRNPAFRKAIVYTKSPYYKTAKSSVTQGVKRLLGVDPNPKIAGKTDAERNKSLYTQSVAGSESTISGKTENKTEEDGDKEGNQSKGDRVAGIDGDAAEEIEAKKASFAEGNFTDAVVKDADMSNVAVQMDREVTDVVGSSSNLGSKMWGFVNALDPLDVICTTYQIAHTAEMAARGVALANTVKMGAILWTTLEKAKAGDDDGELTRYFMEMIQLKDPETGRSFDSTSYAAFLFSGKLSSEPSAVNAFGGQAMVALMMGMHGLHTFVGTAIGGSAADGRYALKNGCNIITNLGVQIVATVGVAALSAISGGAAGFGVKAAGEVVKGGLKLAREKITEAVVSKFGKAAIKEELGKLGSEGSLKYFGSRAWKGLKTTLGSISPAGKAAFLLAAVSTFGMPYLINALSGGNVAGAIKSGPMLIDTAGTSTEHVDSRIGGAIGMTIGTGVTTMQYQEVKDEYEQRYIADATYEAKDSPFDLTTPYSTLGSAVLGVQKTIGIANSLNMFSTLKSIASLPLRLPGLGSVAHAAEDDATPRKMTQQVTGGVGFAVDNDIALTSTGSYQMVANKKLTFEDVEDKFIKGDNPMLRHENDDEESGEPKISIIPGTPLDVYVKKCKNPQYSEPDPEFRISNPEYPELDDPSGPNSYVNQCIKKEGHPEYQDYDDAYIFVNQIGPEERAVEQAATDSGSGAVAVDGFAWPFGEDDYKKNTAAYKKAHSATNSIGNYTGTAWGDADKELGVSNKGGGIAIDIGHHSEGTKVYAMFSGVVRSTSLCGVGDGVAIVSDAGGKKLGVAYMHGQNKQVKVGDAVEAGDYIMDQGNFGCNSFGSHLHIGIVYDSKYICPQDIFAQAATGNMSFDFGAMTKKGKPTCGR